MTGFVIKSICNQFELSWWTISGAKQWEFIESEASLIRNWEPEGKIIAKYFSEWVQHYDFHDKIMQKHNLGQSGIVAFSHFSWLIFRDDFITNLCTWYKHPSFFPVSICWTDHSSTKIIPCKFTNRISTTFRANRLSFCDFSFRWTIYERLKIITLGWYERIGFC